MKIFLVVLFSLISLFAEDNATLNDINSSYKDTIATYAIDNNITDNHTTELNANIQIQEAQILYMHYDEIPTRIIRGEIFPITIRILSTESDFYELNYNLNNSVGLESLNALPYREERGKFYYDTFYFLAKNTGAKLPDFEAFITSFDGTEHRPTTLNGKKLNVVALNPKKNFSNIIANSFTLEEYKTTSYDSNHNIVVFVATAQNSHISSFHLKNVYKQGIESSTEDIMESKITYFAVIAKEIENFNFTYFNLLENRFESINIPITVVEDSVTTQTDLKPKDHSREKLKMLISIALALVLLIIIIWTKKYIYSIALIFPIAYAMYTYTPAKEICIRPNSNIYLLPVKNGTIFETTQGVTYLMEEGNIKGHTKVKLQNNKIGWVKHENLCSY